MLGIARNVMIVKLFSVFVIKFSFVIYVVDTVVTFISKLFII